MTLHDPSVGMSYGWDRHFRWSWGRHGLGRFRRKPKGPGARVSVPYRRRLAAIERSLAADAPALSSKFAMFNHLTKGERAVGVEQISMRAWPRPRPVVAILLALAAIATLCVTLSTQIHSAVRPCSASAATGATHYVPMRGVNCPAYSGIKQLKAATDAVTPGRKAAGRTPATGRRAA
jgi:hypothetical protein